MPFEGINETPAFRNRKIGTTVPEGINNIPDFLRWSRFDWEVEVVRTAVELPHRGPDIAPPTFKIMKNSYAVIRKDTDKVLGTNVSARYTPLQNKDAFGLLDEWLRNGTLKLDICGVDPYSGALWVLAKTNNEYRVLGKDPMVQYYLFRQGHDGKTSFSSFFLPIRVFCSNMFRMVSKEYRNSEFSFAHTKGIEENVANFGSNIGRAASDFIKYGYKADVLARKNYNRDDFESFIEYVFPDDSDKNDRGTISAATLERRTRFRRIAEMPDNGDHTPVDLRRTFWMLFQSATFLTTHELTVRAKTDEARANKRFSNVIQGMGYDINRRAIFAAEELCLGRELPLLK